MKRFAKTTVRKSTAAVMAVIIGCTTLLAACSVDYDQLSQGLNDLGDSIMETTESSVEVTESNEPSETTVTSTPTPTPTPTPTATPTPTPTPTPLPERVDFSELTTDEITADFTVETEAFEESSNTEDGDALVTFSGVRMVVSDESAENVQTAINMILDGFYQEADGIYRRMSNEAQAEASLVAITEGCGAVTVNFEYSDNGRVLSVIMTRSVTDMDGNVTDATEYASFDMLTGQYVTMASIASDAAGLEAALKAKLAADVNVVPEEPEQTTETDATEETIKNSRKEVSAADVSNIYIAVQEPGAQTATVVIYGEIDGVTCHTTVDMNEYAQYLNRYGKLVLFVS